MELLDGIFRVGRTEKSVGRTSLNSSSYYLGYQSVFRILREKK